MPLIPARHVVDIAESSTTLSGTAARNLPFSADLAAPWQATPPAQTLGTVLLVEDDIGLREITSVLLTAVGYRVIACSDAEAASHVFLSGHSGPVDLLLTDIEMPGQSGVELARELTSFRPSLPVLIVSGSLISSDLEREMEERNWRFVGKPFRLPALLNIVQELVPSAPEAAA